MTINKNRKDNDFLLLKNHYHFLTTFLLDKICISFAIPLSETIFLMDTLLNIIFFEPVIITPIAAAPCLSPRLSWRAIRGEVPTLRPMF